MPWIKVLDTLPDHPRAVKAGPEAMWLYIAGLCYCNRLKTDGMVPGYQVPRLTTIPKPERSVSRLVDVGLWESVEDGYQVMNYLKFQRSSTEIEALSRTRAEAGSLGGQAKHGRVASDSEANDKQIAKQNPSNSLKQKRREEKREEKASKPFVLSDESDEHRDKPWSTHEKLKTLIETLDAAVPFSLNGASGLYHENFWDRIEALTDGTKVYYDDELRKYVAWLTEQPPSHRHKSLQRGFTRWIRKAIAIDGWQEKRKEFQR